MCMCKNSEWTCQENAWKDEPKPLYWDFFPQNRQNQVKKEENRETEFKIPVLFIAFNTKKESTTVENFSCVMNLYPSL